MNTEHAADIEATLDQPKPTGEAHRLFEPEDEPNIISRSTPTQPKPHDYQIMKPETDSFIEPAEEMTLDGSHNDSPRPYQHAQGEWTGMTVANIAAGCVHISPILRERIADAHNAALAEAVDQWTRSRCFVTLESYERLEKQLDAEREKVQTLVDALKEIAHCLADTDKWTCVSIARDALAKVKDL